MKKRYFIACLAIFMAIFFARIDASASPKITMEDLMNEIKSLKSTNDKLQNEILSLKHDHSALKKQLEEVKSENSDASGSESSELSDLEKELESIIAGEGTTSKTDKKLSVNQSLGNAGATNPDIGAVGIITYNAAKRNNEKGGSDVANTFQFDEAEFVVSGYVDPFHKYDLVLGFHEDEVGVEEAYLSKFDLPWKLAGRIGKFRTNFGFINQHHLDELPWAGEHIFLDTFLGAEGITTTGFELKKTLGTSGCWTPTVSIEVGSGEDYDATVAGSTPNPLNPWQTRTYSQNRRVLGRLRNSFNLGATTDLTLGLSYLAADHGELDVMGADFQFKARPNAYSGWTVLGEYVKRRDDAYNFARAAAGLGKMQPDGYMLSAEYQWDHFWKTGLIWSEFDSSNRLQAGLSRSKIAYLTYLPTEFSRYLLQFEEREMAGFQRDQRLTLQLLFSVGYHRHKLK
jgi:FtsZ-binding cell division protein ZapB